MAAIRKTITVTDSQNDWIKSQIERGDYANDSELIRDLIRKAQARQADIDALREAIRIGEESGVSDLSPEDVRQKVLKRRGLA